MSARPPEEPGPGAAAMREHLRRRLAAWLEDLLADEPAPEGVDPAVCAAQVQAVGAEPDAQRPDRACDLYALWSAMTALTQEVKLQGRTFKQLQETLAPLAELGGALAAVADAQRAASGQVVDLAAEVRRAVDSAEQARRSVAEQRGLLDVLLDLYDRLQRGLALCDQRRVAGPQAGAPPTLWQRLRALRQHAEPAPGALEALREGYALGMQRLADALREQDIVPIEALGRPFDPHVMQVVEVGPPGSVAEGTVLAVHQPGFLRGGQVLRLARVKVAGRPEAAAAEQEHDR